MNTALEEIDSARFRATAGDVQGFGATPREALDALMIRLPDSPETPIVIWPFNHGDRFFSDTQQSRLRDLRSRRSSLSPAEATELEKLVEAAFDATIARTESFQPTKP